MFFLFASLAAAAPCPAAPELRDPDDQVTALAQNLKFIATGGRRAERARVLADYLGGEGAEVDLLLLSEARITGELERWSAEWCFYTQVGNGLDGYRWAPIEQGRSPGGLALGVRQRPWGELLALGDDAGRRFRAAPVSFAEGVLGRLVDYRKGWARLKLGDTEIVWSHMQASYGRRPHVGAGGRVGQFEELAEDLGHGDRAALLTGDLNLLSGFRPRRDEDEPRVSRARAIDEGTVERFRERTGMDLEWFRPKDRGSFAGTYLKDEPEEEWDLGAPYDRVGVNEAFLRRHPGTRVQLVEIAEGALRVSDHLGLEITIPNVASR